MPWVRFSRGACDDKGVAHVRRHVDHMLGFHRPRGMSCSHFRNVIKVRCWTESLRLCGKKLGCDGYCCRAKGHEGDCDDIPF